MFIRINKSRSKLFIRINKYGWVGRDSAPCGRAISFLPEGSLQGIDL